MTFIFLEKSRVIIKKSRVTKMTEKRIMLSVYIANSAGFLEVLKLTSMNFYRVSIVS